MSGRCSAGSLRLPHCIGALYQWGWEAHEERGPHIYTTITSGGKTKLGLSNIFWGEWPLRLSVSRCSGLQVPAQGKWFQAYVDKDLLWKTTSPIWPVYNHYLTCHVDLIDHKIH